MFGNKRWKRRLVLAIAGLFVLDLVVFFAGVRPFRLVEQQRVTQRDDLRRQYEERSREVERLRDVASKLDAARQQVDIFLKESLLPQKTGYSAIVNELDAITAAAAVRKGTVTFKSDPVEGQNMLKVGITTAVEGDYPSLARFVNRLEQSERFFIIENLSLASSTGSPLIKLNVRLLTYFTS